MPFSLPSSKKYFEISGYVDSERGPELDVQKHYLVLVWADLSSRVEGETVMW